MNNHIKSLKTLIATLAAFAVVPLFAGDGHDHHDHDGHDHHAAEDHHGHDHGGHQHEAREAGPNGGRVIDAIEPHFEFLVRDDRMVQITFLDDHGEAIAPAGQEISATTGSRAAPVNLTFAAEGDVLVSDVALPEGNNLPIILSMKPSADGKTKRERFTINLNNCPTCENKEYACTCGH